MTRQGDKTEPAPCSASTGQGCPMYSTSRQAAQQQWGAADLFLMGVGSAHGNVLCTARSIEMGYAAASQPKRQRDTLLP